MSSQSLPSEEALISPSKDTNWAMLYPELIYEILTHCHSGATLSVGTPSTFPWYLGHICRSWRSVFISSPHFWDRFTFDVLTVRTEMATISRLERSLTLVQMCIDRTKGHPFSFSFGGLTYAKEVPRTLYSIQILETLVAHADRWHTAYLKSDAEGLQESLVKAKHRFLQLHTLRICVPLGSSHDYISSDLFEDAPHLTRVYATDYHQLRWSTITVLHIELAPRTSHRFFAELDKMTCLQELVVMGLPLRLELANTTPIEMPSLVSFSVDHYFPTSLIRAPSLERLYLATALLGGDASSSIVENFIRGVNNLKTLSFHAPNVDVARIIDCTPELDHLILLGITSSLDPLRSLASCSAARSLRKINIGIKSPNPVPSSVSVMHQLTDIVESWEKRQFPKLHSLSVYVKGHAAEDIASAIADLTRLSADKGLEVEIAATPFPMLVPFGDWKPR